MREKDFARKCAPYIKLYEEKFGQIPHAKDYICSQDDFFKALSASVSTGKNLGEYLVRRTSLPQTEDSHSA